MRLKRIDNNFKSAVMEKVKRRYPKKKLFQDLIIVFILGLVPLLWFKSGCIINGPDVCFPLAPVRFFINRFFTWNHLNNTGLSSASNITTIFFHGIQAFFYWISSSLFLTQKASYCFWFTAICLSMYYFISVIQKENPNRLQRFVAVLVYAFNPFVFNIWEVAKAAELSSLVAMPVMLGFFIQGLDGRLNYLKASVFAGLLSLLFSEMGASPSVFVMPVGICLGYFVFYCIIEILKGARVEHLFLLFGFLGLFFGVYLLFNFFWILPYSFELLNTLKTSTSKEVLEAFNMVNWLKGISTHTSILNVIRFQGAWDWYYSWQGEPYVAYAKTYFNHSFFLLMSVALPILAYMAVLFKRNKEVLFFMVVAFIGTLFATGAHPPFGCIFLWITKKIPVFLVFRSPYYKFSLATLFAYAYLVSVSVSAIYHKCNFSKRFKASFRISSTKEYKLVPNLLILILIIFYLSYNFPMLTGKIIPQDRKKLFPLHLKIPPYVFETTKWLDEQGEGFRLLSLPRENLDTYRWGYGAPTNLLNLIESNVPVIWGRAAFAGKNEIRDLFYDNLYNQFSVNVYKILRLLSVKYIWLRHDAWYDFYGDTISPADLKEKIMRMKPVQFTKRIGEWEFYKVPNTSELIGVVYRGNMVFGDIKALAALCNRHNIDDSAFIFEEQNSEEKINYLFQTDLIKEITFFNYPADKIKDKLKERKLNYKNYNFSLFYTTDILPFEFKSDYALAEGIKVEKKLGFSSPENLEDGEDWMWLYTNKKPNIIITNSYNKEQMVNLIFDVFSYETDRSLYIYLNDNLLQCPHLEANKVTTIKLKKLALLPGRNVISFYTPCKLERRKGHLVSFAFRDFRICSLLYRGKVFIPQDGYYNIDVFPYSLEVLEKNDINLEEGKEFIIDGKSVRLDYAGENHLRKQKIYLNEGMHTFKIGQFSTEDYYVEFSTYTKRKESINKKIKFTQCNPTKYKLTSDIDRPCFIIFNEAYSPNWKLYADGADIKTHFKVNGYANAWYIDSEQAEIQHLILEFWLQRLTKLGGLISLISAVLILSMLITHRTKKWNM